jgi:Tfp pilus assembly protein PilF
MALGLPRLCPFFIVSRLNMFQSFLSIFLSFAIWLPVCLGQISAPDAEDVKNMAIEQVLADFEAKKYKEALEKLHTLQKTYPDDPLIFNLIGSVQIKKKDYAAAWTSFREALKNQPGFFPAEYNLGEILFLEKKYAEAREHFQAMRASDTRHELLQFKVFLCDLQSGEKDRARRVMNAIKYPGDSPAWYYAKAAWEYKQGNLKKAREYVLGAKYIFGDKTALFDETFETLNFKL